MNIAKDIVKCVTQLIGPAYVPQPTPTRLSTGARVYRIAGSQELHYDKETNQVWTIKYTSGAPQRIDITSDNLEEIRQTMPGFCEWEFRVLARGRENTRQELQNALTKLGHAVTVRIGGKNDYGWYVASIAVEMLSRPIASNGEFNIQNLASELVSIGEVLAPLQKTLNDVSLRLQALGIALALKQEQKNKQ